MPTRDRRAFVPLAIACFLAQDYEHRELLILDDGDDPVADLVPPDPRIRYERLAEPLVLGAKRNRACALARGELIAHWDDDDWSAPRRLSRQVQALADADISGLDDLYFFDPLAERAWRYVYPDASTKPWVAGGTLCYRRAFWEAHPFPEIRIGEDSRFVWVPSARIAPLHDVSLYAATVHAANTSAKRPRPPRWRPADAAQVAAVLGDAAAGYRAAARGETAAAGPHVVVTIPYHRCRAHIRECVDSVLAQTHRHLTAIVVNDGDPEPPWDLLADIDDPRLVRFDLPRNHGRYFADQVVLQAITAPYLLIHDADDWSERHRIATLLRSLRAEHAIGAVSAAKGRGAVVSRLVQPPPERLQHIGQMHGLFRTDALRAVGGMYAGLRVGYDTFLINALAMTGRLAPVAEPLYTWRRRADSLTTSAGTGMRSDLRRRSTAALQEMHRDAYAAYRRYLDGGLEADALASTIGALGRARVPEEERREIDAQARRLAELLGADPRTATALPREAAPPRAHLIASDAWTISRPLAVELEAFLERRRPRRILELGSGLSTTVLARYARRAGAALVTLEHDETYAKLTRERLARDGLDADVRVAPLRPFACPDGSARPFYAADPGGGFDFVLIDGPPSAHGRGATLFAIWERLADDWDVWIDDGAREHERECLALWQSQLRFELAHHDLDGKGLAALAPAGRPPTAPEPALPGLGIGVLTGGRPDLLRRTLDSLAEHAGPALDAAYVLVRVNGGDPVAERHLKSLPFVDRVETSSRRHDVGAATSALMARLAARRDVECIMHLEDDWAAGTLSPGWLARAAAILEDEAGIGQVRLRHRADTVLATHMVTGRPIAWEPDGDVLRSPCAHYTFNPSLTRAREAALVFPAAGEREAQARFLQAGLGTAQLAPGVFHHLGEQRSLTRARRGRRRYL